MKKLLFTFCLLCISASLISAQSDDKIKERDSKKLKKIEKKLEELEMKIDNSLISEEVEGVFNSLEDFPHFTKEIASNPNKAILGVQIKDASANNGANITYIYKDSGADKAGLKEEDLILAINNKKIMDTEELINSLSDAKVGDKVEVRILRNGEVMNFIVEMGKPSEQTCHVYNIRHCKPLPEEYLEKLNNLEKDIKKKIKKTIIIKSDDEKTELKDGDSNLSVEYLSGIPNPSTGNLTITFNGKKEPFTVIVSDINGRELFKEEVKSNEGTYNKTIQLDNADGAVIIHVQQGDKASKSKVIIQK